MRSIMLINITLSTESMPPYLSDIKTDESTTMKQTAARLGDSPLVETVLFLEIGRGSPPLKECSVHGDRKVLATL